MQFAASVAGRVPLRSETARDEDGSMSEREGGREARFGTCRRLEKRSLSAHTFRGCQLSSVTHREIVIFRRGRTPISYKCAR